jgi:hypothetical protein
MTSFIAFLVLAALIPQMATAGHGGGGGHSGGGGGHYGGGGSYYGGRGGYYGVGVGVGFGVYGVGGGVYGVGGGYGNPYGYGYGGNYGYYQPATPYVVQRPIIENPTFSGLPIEISNPATSGATLSYVLNGVTYSIPAGYSQNLTLDRSWVISFSRGGNFGPARYGLEPGLYTFSSTDHGWELYHGEIAPPSVLQTPSNTLPMNRTPSAAMRMTPPAPGLVK